MSFMNAVSSANQIVQINCVNSYVSQVYVCFIFPEKESFETQTI